MSNIDESNAGMINEAGDIYLFSRVSPTLRVGFVRILRALSAIDQRLDRAAARFRELDADLEAAAEITLRIRVVPAIEDLPEEAEPTEWFRVVATPAQVYVGNGSGRPLSKFTTTAL